MAGRFGKDCVVDLPLWTSAPSTDAFVFGSEDWFVNKELAAWVVALKLRGFCRTSSRLLSLHTSA
eukprot:5951137-Amphidinium_carterae.1